MKSINKKPCKSDPYETQNLPFPYIMYRQEVKEIVPECVHYDELNDIYSMEYTAIIPVLVEGIKEQQEVIEALQSEIMELRKMIKNK